MLLLSVSILIGRQAESIAAEAGQSDRTVSGIVVDSNREPVAGASVVVKGTLNGTATDANGHFELTVNDGDVLEVSFLGFATAEQTVYVDKFKALGCEVSVCTEDGSLGVKGYVTKAMEGLSYSHFYTCGPEAMFKAVSDCSVTSGQFSFEQRMGCGFGACMGCSCETLYGVKRICKEGPVLVKEEIKWRI